jgi:hypothetical protein
MFEEFRTPVFPPNTPVRESLLLEATDPWEISGLEARSNIDEPRNLTAGPRVVKEQKYLSKTVEHRLTFSRIDVHG